MPGIFMAGEPGGMGLIRNAIEQGRRGGACERTGHTPLMLASDRGHTGTVKALIAAGSEVDAKNSNGNTALMLLLYPFRKKSRFMRNWGGVKHWFRAHMIMGVAGPVLVAYHSNFSLGSMNSNVALVSMLTVAGSGLIGRYFYSRVHRGLYGREVTLKELRQDLEANMEKSVSVLSYSPAVHKRLLAFDAEMLKARDSAVERSGPFCNVCPV